jgi:hypothetical protein
MKFREVTLSTGQRFKVPQGIQRIDHKSTHGWQLRYAGTKLFSDGPVGREGAAASLTRAIQELHSRIAKMPAPNRLQSLPNHNKTSDLPVGISGPIVRQRAGSGVQDCSLSVSLPRFGEAARRRSIYIGTENTYTPERYALALAKAVVLRQQAEVAYRRASTRAKRLETEQLLPKRARPASSRSR